MNIFSESSDKFKKFDYSEDDEDEFGLDDFFSEFHGNTFNFHGFPPTVLKQFQEIIEAMQEFEAEPENNNRQKSFENKYKEFRQKTDQDLDGQIYADQLDTLLKRISPEFTPNSSSAPQDAAANQKKKFKQSDEDKIMDIIHGTYREEIVPVKPRKRQVQKVPAMQSPHHFGLPPFDLPPTGSRTWGKTVISIRKPDGTYETRKTERSPDGQTTTTITKTDTDGTKSTQTFMGEGGKAQAAQKSAEAGANYNERNLLTTSEGYKIPCLW